MTPQNAGPGSGYDPEGEQRAPAQDVELAYDIMARSHFNLQKERLRSIVEKTESSPEVVRDSLNTTKSYTYSTTTVSVVNFVFIRSISARVTTDEGDYALEASSYDWWPGPPKAILGPGFFSSAGSAEMNYPIQELVGRDFRFTALFSGTQSSVTWQGHIGEQFGNFVGSPLHFWPYTIPDIHVAWGSGTIRAVVG
ncbi:hypothetical protein ACFQ8S_03460 [Streptomyces virginiae]|uniref:hypothetical protein n=1 Tax=Streptomyces virginiae TaxID=1961 RepID=UPI00369AD3F4